jgi:hypothetical protein
VWSVWVGNDSWLYCDKYWSLLVWHCIDLRLTYLSSVSCVCDSWISHSSTKFVCIGRYVVTRPFCLKNLSMKVVLSVTPPDLGPYAACNQCCFNLTTLRYAGVAYSTRRGPESLRSLESLTQAINVAWSYATYFPVVHPCAQLWDTWIRTTPSISLFQIHFNIIFLYSLTVDSPFRSVPFKFSSLDVA